MAVLGCFDFQVLGLIASHTCLLLLLFFRGVSSRGPEVHTDHTHGNQHPLPARRPQAPIRVRKEKYKYIKMMLCKILIMILP